MDGAKLATDTAEYLKVNGRQAFRVGRSILAREYGPRGNENPGGSRILVL